MTSRSLDLRAAGRVAHDLIHNPWRPGTPAELEAALRHHDRALDALGRMLRYGAELRRHHERAVTLQEALIHPLHALLGELDRFPRLGSAVDRPPSEILGEQPALGGPWRDLDRELLLADHAYSQAAHRMPAEVRWGLVADVAALAGSLSLLTADLAHACVDFDQFRAADTLRGSASATLLRMATVALELAATGPTRDSWTPPDPPARAVPVLDLHDFPPAAAALSQMLNHDGLRLDASDMLAIAGHHAVTGEVIGRFLTDHGRPGLGCVLREHAALLVAGARAAHHRTFSAIPLAHRQPAWQARELYWAARQHIADLGPAPGQIARGHAGERSPFHARLDVAIAYAALVPTITCGLSDRTTAALASSDWAVRNLLSWRPAHPSDLKPFRDALRDASDRVAHLAPAGTASAPGAADHPDAAHRLLASSLSRPSTTSPRPPLPHTPPVHAGRRSR